jgi:hypothetical protein
MIECRERRFQEEKSMLLDWTMNNELIMWMGGGYTESKERSRTAVIGHVRLRNCSDGGRRERLYVMGGVHGGTVSMKSFYYL